MTDIDQSMQALALANTVRLRRSELRRKVADGTMSVMTAINDPACARTLLMDVLAWQKNWSPSKATTVLRRLAFNDSVFCGQMTARQRAILSRWLRASMGRRESIELHEQVRWHSPSEAA